MPKRSRSGVVIRPERVVAPTSCERIERDLDRARRRPFADHQIELVILHRGIKDFLDHGIEAVDLVDEEARRRGSRWSGWQRDRPPWPAPARGRAEIDAELARHDLRQRRLAQPGWAGEQHVVERFPGELWRPG